MGAPNDCGWRRNLLTMSHHNTFFNTVAYICFPNSSSSNIGDAKLASWPGRHLTSLCLCRFWLISSCLYCCSTDWPISFLLREKDEVSELWHQGRNKGAQLPGCRITAGGAKWLWEAPESPNNVTCTFFNTVNLFPKDHSFKRGGTKLVSWPGCHSTSLRPCMACERSCSVTMFDRRVMSQYHSLVVMLIFSKQFLGPGQSGAHSTCHACHTLDTPLLLPKLACVWPTQYQARNQEGRSPPYNIFRSPLEKCVGHSSKILNIL